MDNNRYLPITNCRAFRGSKHFLDTYGKNGFLSGRILQFDSGAAGSLKVAWKEALKVLLSFPGELGQQYTIEIEF